MLHRFVGLKAGTMQIICRGKAVPDVASFWTLWTRVAGGRKSEVVQMSDFGSEDKNCKRAERLFV